MSPAVRQSRARPAPSAHRRGAFTLLEILVVIALIGLLAGVLVTGVDAMLSNRPETPAQALWHAARAARRHALQNQTEVTLSYDAESGEFTAVALDGTVLEPVKPPAGTLIEFLPGLLAPTPTSTGVNGVINRVYGSMLDTADEPVDHVTFYGDGTSSLFRVSIQSGGASGTFANGKTTVIQVDPWTCSPMLGSTSNGTSG